MVIRGREGLIARNRRAARLQKKGRSRRWFDPVLVFAAPVVAHAGQAYAIRLGASTGRAKMASSQTSIEAAIGLTFRLMIKGDKLVGVPSSKTHVCGVEDAAGANVKATLVLDRDGSNIVTPMIHHPTDGYINVGGTWTAASVDPNAWYEILASVHNGAATWARRCLIWNRTAGSLFFSFENNAGVSNFPTTSGYGCFTLNKSDFFWTVTQGDYDWAAVYSGTPYDAHDENTGPPVRPKTVDSGILGLWPIEENTGASLTNVVAGGNALAVTNGTWASGFDVVSSVPGPKVFVVGGLARRKKARLAKRRAQSYMAIMALVPGPAAQAQPRAFAVFGVSSRRRRKDLVRRRRQQPVTVYTSLEPGPLAGGTSWGGHMSDAWCRVVRP